jgi:3-deoxy-manno-octulosonate cytidylyltransferase (CMP-KDO synthetase)
LTVAFHVVIPARYASTRLPGKALLEIGGRPMIQHVVERACASRADRVLVATDDARIAAAIRDPRGTAALPIALMTDPQLPSGTDRVAAAAVQCGWVDETIVVNLQGDEPFMPALLIDQVAELLAAHPEAAIATLMSPIDDAAALLDPNVVKVVVGLDGCALYFSRAPIPWTRDGVDRTSGRQRRHDGAMRHIGLYAYRVGALRTITRLRPSLLEGIERLEQLRALENGLKIAVARCIVEPGPGIDTEADLEAARTRLRE